MIFEDNISALKKCAPELADTIMSQGDSAELDVVNTKSSMPSLRLNNMSLHSLYDPVKEAEAWVRHYEQEINGSECIYVLGFGLGYHVLELCKLTERPITVFEPRTDILRKALDTVDLTSIISKIKIVTDNSLEQTKDRPVVLHHKPSVSLNQKYFDDICARLQAMEAINRGLRILVVSPIYGGSLPVARYCSSSLIKMGHTVEFIDNSRFHDALFFADEITANRQRYNTLMNHLSAFISEAVLARCETFKPDLVLALAQTPLTPDCLTMLRQHKVTTAYWFVEDFRFMDYWKRIAGHYDFFFTIQKDQFFIELQNAGITNYHYLPMAACPEVHKPVELSDDDKKYFGSDVSFVGAGYYNRRHFLEGLLDLDFKIWGTDWDMHSALARCVQQAGARIDTDDTVKIFNASTININLHSSTYHKGINPFGDFVNPRTFEIISSGGFQLSDRRSGLDGLFEAGEEIVLFEGIDDLRSMIRHYLENPEAREKIIKQGRQRVLKEHTYEHRMREMLRVISAKGFHRPLWTEEGEDVKNLIKDAGEESELGRYLSRFAENKKITLPDIHKEISKGEGEISRTEALFMVMHEFAR